MQEQARSPAQVIHSIGETIIDIIMQALNGLDNATQAEFLVVDELALLFELVLGEETILHLVGKYES